VHRRRPLLILTSGGTDGRLIGFAPLRLGGSAFRYGLTISKNSDAAFKRRAAKPQRLNLGTELCVELSG
jgi:hypothetical protein